MGEEGEDFEEEDFDNLFVSYQLVIVLGMNVYWIQVMKVLFFVDQFQLSLYLFRDVFIVDKVLFSGLFGKVGYLKSFIYLVVKLLGLLLFFKVICCVDEGGQLFQLLFGSFKIGNLIKSCLFVLV